MISYISKKHKLQISHIPKSGCQSVRKFLIKINNDRPDLDIWSREFATKYIINTTNTVNGNTHLSIVRNPYERLVSCYYNKIAGAHWPHFYKYFKNTYSGDRPSFYEFVKELYNGKIYSNEHWIPQYLLIGNKNTHIIQIEKKDMLNERIHGITGYEFFHYKSNYHMHNKKDFEYFVGEKDGGELNSFFLKSEQPKSSNFYNDKIRTMVKRLYEVDFKTLGY